MKVCHVCGVVHNGSHFAIMDCTNDALFLYKKQLMIALNDIKMEIKRIDERLKENDSQNNTDY